MIARAEPRLKVLVFGAALRADSLNRKLAALAARVAKQSGATVDHASMRDFDVPSYDGDAEAAEGIPKGAEELRRRLVESDAFIVASPEYTPRCPACSRTSSTGLRASGRSRSTESTACS